MYKNNQAAITLRTFPSTENLINALINQIEKENDLSVKAEMITTLGEMGERAIKTLERYSNDTNPQISRRSLVSLSKMNKISEIQQQSKMTALKICNELLESDSIEEKKQVCYGLRYLKVTGEIIMKKLLNLLSDKDGSVKLEAAKTLNILQEITSYAF